MSSLSDTTNDIKIENPHLWTLSLFVDDRHIHFMLHNDQEHNSLICRDIEIGTWSDDEEHLRAVENAVYDNPLLLSEFKRVNVSVDSMQFIFLPPGYGTDEDARHAFDVAFPGATGDFQFLRRTFSNAPVRLHLETMCSYFRGKTNASTINKVAVYIRNGRIDVCAFKHGRLQIANTYVCRSNDDAVFYTLAVWNMLGLDVRSDEIQIAGDKTVRAAITPRLREYVTYVVPVMMPPAAMRMASDAAKAPLNLIILAI